MTQKLTTVLPAVLNKIRPGATFLSVKKYMNNHGEVSNFGLVFHVNYTNGVKRAIHTWSNYHPQTKIESMARMDLIKSYTDTLRGFNPRYKNQDAYERIVDAEGNVIRGCKWLKSGQEVQLWGFQVHKLVLVPGEYPQVKSRELTLAKKRLMSLTPLTRFRQFKIVEGRFESIGVDNLTLIQKDILRELEDFESEHG